VFPVIRALWWPALWRPRAALVPPDDSWAWRCWGQWQRAREKLFIYNRKGLCTAASCHLRRTSFLVLVTPSSFPKEPWRSDCFEEWRHKAPEKWETGYTQSNRIMFIPAVDVSRICQDDSAKVYEIWQQHNDSEPVQENVSQNFGQIKFKGVVCNCCQTAYPEKNKNPPSLLVRQTESLAPAHSMGWPKVAIILCFAEEMCQWINMMMS